ncbi:MAG: PLP-dependent transferase, partial [Pluralibacter gergoviae]|nr:PLP-dependent transferase [Pluralibacter gergoviae]
MLGRNPDEQSGFVNSPVYRGSTVLFKTCEDIRQNRARFAYGTQGTPTIENLENAWSALCGAAGTVISPSGLGALALALIRLHGRAVAGVAMTLLLVVWGVLSAHQALWPTRHLTGAIRQAEVILSETDGQTLHRGQMVRLRGRYLFPPVGVTLYGELAPAPACAGQHWLMTLRLRPVHGQLNDGGFDSQRYAL